MEKYHEIDLETYYRKGVYQHFTADCKCSISMTCRLDVTALYQLSKDTGTKFYVNVLYLITKALNSRDDYKMVYLWKEDKLVVFDKINPTHYVFLEDTETCVPVYSEFSQDYPTFYARIMEDTAAAKQLRTYQVDLPNHLNWFDASYLPWASYDALHVELPDGHLFFNPIVNWGRFREENGRKMMPITVRLNHAVADGYLLSKVFATLEGEMQRFVQG